MKIVCTITKADLPAIPESMLKEKPEFDRVLSTEFTLERQRGTWNKDTLKWWVRHPNKEEIFNDSREVFLRKIFNLAFTEVDIEIPIVFIQAESEDDADIVITFMARKDSPYHRDNPNVLAYAGYEDGALKGIMVIYTDWDWMVTGNLNIVTVIIHELLHIMGRPHSERRLWIDIMDPTINSRITELSDWDILGLTTAYGAREYNTITGHDRLEKATRRSKERLAVEGLLPYAKSN